MTSEPQAFRLEQLCNPIYCCCFYASSTSIGPSSSSWRIIHYPNESQLQGAPALASTSPASASAAAKQRCCVCQAAVLGAKKSPHWCLYALPLLLHRHSPRLARAGSTNIAATVLAVCKGFASICKCIGACASCGGPLLQKSEHLTIRWRGTQHKAGYLLMRILRIRCAGVRCVTLAG